MQMIAIYQGASGSRKELAGAVARASGYGHIANHIDSIPGAKKMSARI